MCCLTFHQKKTVYSSVYVLRSIMYRSRKFKAYTIIRTLLRCFINLLMMIRYLHFPGYLYTVYDRHFLAMDHRYPELHRKYQFPGFLLVRNQFNSASLILSLLSNTIRAHFSTQYYVQLNQRKISWWSSTTNINRLSLRVLVSQSLGIS